MSDLQPLGIQGIKVRHHAVTENWADAQHGDNETICYWCAEKWPCMTGEVLDAYERQQADLEACRAENARYKEALEFYADKDNWKDSTTTYEWEYGVESERMSALVWGDQWETARAALQSREEVSDGYGERVMIMGTPKDAEIFKLNQRAEAAERRARNIQDQLMEAIQRAKAAEREAKRCRRFLQAAAGAVCINYLRTGHDDSGCACGGCIAREAIVALDGSDGQKEE